MGGSVISIEGSPFRRVITSGTAVGVWWGVWNDEAKKNASERVCNNKDDDRENA